MLASFMLRCLQDMGDAVLMLALAHAIMLRQNQ
jgi:hypothetical protein